MKGLKHFELVRRKAWITEVALRVVLEWFREVVLIVIGSPHVDGDGSLQRLNQFSARARLASLLLTSSGT